MLANRPVALVESSRHGHFVYFRYIDFRILLDPIFQPPAATCSTGKPFQGAIDGTADGFMGQPAEPNGKIECWSVTRWSHRFRLLVCVTASPTDVHPPPNCSSSN